MEKKNRIAGRGAGGVARPPAPHDRRTASTYIFGAICPKDGKGAALVLPRCNIAAMNLHLAEIAMAVASGAHAVLLLDDLGNPAGHVGLARLILFRGQPEQRTHCLGGPEAAGIV